MNNVMRSFAGNFVINAAFALVFVTSAFGYNSYTSSISWGSGFDKLASVFGGLPSFLALVGLIALAAFVVWGFTALADNQSIHNLWVGIMALGAIVVALFVGKTWLDLPGGVSLIILGFVVLTAAQTWINRRLSA